MFGSTLKITTTYYYSCIDEYKNNRSRRIVAEPEGHFTLWNCGSGYTVNSKIEGEKILCGEYKSVILDSCTICMNEEVKQKIK